MDIKRPCFWCGDPLSEDDISMERGECDRCRRGANTFGKLVLDWELCDKGVLPWDRMRRFTDWPTIKVACDRLWPGLSFAETRRELETWLIAARADDLARPVGNWPMPLTAPERLLRTPASDVAVWLAEEVKAREKPPESPELPSSEPQLNGEARALAVLVKHPEWSDTKIADEAGCSRASLYRWPIYQSARDAMKAGRERFGKARDL